LAFSQNNILIDDNGVAQLSDFGRAKIIPELAAATISINAGNAEYMAPELFAGFRDLDVEFTPRYSTKSDIYAFAMVSYEVYLCFLARSNALIDFLRSSPIEHPFRSHIWSIRPQS
jgi:serine/threonine protein kinase